MSEWGSAPICEACWIDREAVWEGDRLVSIRQVTRLTEPEIERCCWCGGPTIFGAYVRAKWSDVPFPRLTQ